jgi:hypothetical protein
MTITSPIVTVINNILIFFVSQATMKYINYPPTIQSVASNKVVLILVSYASSIISRNMLREIQGLKIDHDISILGV